jgi:murein DD-endopeptidase MepM/ murein hydrolase activator NlpD
MTSYSLVARGSIITLVGLFIVQGTPIGQRLARHWSADRASEDILYSKSSPFQSDSFKSVDSLLSSASENMTQASIPETFEHKVKKGATLASLWREIKGAPEAVSSFVSAFSHKHPKLKAGEVVSVTRKGDEVVELRRELGQGATLVISGDSGEGYVPRIEQASISTRERKVTGTISSSLVNAANALDVPYSVVDDFVDLFSARVEFQKDLQPGDTFTVSYDERVVEGGKVLESGSIKSASLFLSGEMYAVVRDVATDGAVRYFDEKGEMPTKAFLRYPVQFTRIGSMFSHARFHPILRVSRPHNGVDFSAPIGTPVRTVGDGVVVFSGFTPSTGYMVRIAHSSQYTTEYMHLSRISPAARKGARVSRGGVIGALGNTGLSTGPHLHFGLFDRGKYVDPMKAKVIQATPEIKAPKAVLAAIAEMKKTHKELALTVASGVKKRA